MAQSIVWNNATFIIPDVGESSWGQNLTNYFVAIPQGAYQASGGTLPLTADLSFGSNFGLFAKYLTSVTANPASAGVVRLANTESVEWRNAANNANLALTVNASNQLTFNGNVIPTDTTTITAKSFLYGDAAGLIASTSSPTNGQLLIGSTGNIPVVAALAGTTHQVVVTNGAGTITLSTPQNIDTTSTPTFANLTLSNTTNQIVLGTTNTVTLSSTAPASSRTYTIPDAGGAANVVLDAGNYTIAGTWTFSNSITLASTKAIVLTDNSTNTVTLKATNSTTSWTLSLPTTHGSNGNFLQTDGSGNTTWAPGGSGTVQSGAAGNITLYPAAAASVSDTYVQNSHNITLGIATQGSRSANLAITIPNPGNAVTAVNVVLDQGNYTLAGVYTFSGGAGAITMSGSSTIAMGSNKITGLANGSASSDAAAFGQIPTVTNWASYTPTIGGAGTPTNVAFYWKQVGDTIYVHGSFTTGTQSGNASISLPNSTAINYSKISTVGSWQGIAHRSSQNPFGTPQFAPPDGATAVVFTDGSDTSKVYATYLAGFTKGTWNSNNGDAWSCQFEYPI